MEGDGSDVEQEGYESADSLNNSVIAEEGEDEVSGSGDDSEGETAGFALGVLRGGLRGQRSGRRGRGARRGARSNRHHVEWRNEEIDVHVTDFSGQHGYRGLRLPRGFVEPIGIWSQFWPDQLLAEITEQTNRYALQSSLKPRPANYRADRPWPPRFLQRWRALSVRELKVWIALVYAFGVHSVPTPRDHWSHSWLMETPQFRCVMSRDRFKEIKSCLHLLDDNTPLGPDELPKIGRFLAGFEQRCQVLYYPV